MSDKIQLELRHGRCRTGDGLGVPMELTDSGVISPRLDISLALSLAPATVPTAGSCLIAFNMTFFTGDAARSYFVCARTGPLWLLSLGLVRT